MEATKIHDADNLKNHYTLQCNEEEAQAVQAYLDGTSCWWRRWALVHDAENTGPGAFLPYTTCFTVLLDCDFHGLDEIIAASL